MASKHKCGPASRGQLNLLPRELALIKLAPSAQEHQAQMANEFGPQCLFRQVLCCNWPNISRYNANIMFFKNLSLVYFLGNKNLHNYSQNMLTHQHYEGNSRVKCTQTTKSEGTHYLYLIGNYFNQTGTEDMYLFTRGKHSH